MEGIAEIKLLLYRYIAATNDLSTLNHLKVLLEKDQKSRVFSSDNLPITPEAYKKEIDEIISEAERGLFVTQEQMERGSG